MGTRLVAVVSLFAFALWPAAAAADHDTFGTATLSSGSGLGLNADLSTGLGILSPSPTALASSPGTATVTQGAGLGAADDTSGDFHSANFHKLGRTPNEIRDGELAQGSDLAFKGDLLIAGAYEGVGFFKMGGGGSLEQLSFYDCPGSQGDITVLGKTLFVSVDSRSSNAAGASATCNNTGTNQRDGSVGREGLRIVDISNPRAPRQIGFVETECGSHTQTLIPGDTVSYIYVASYPLTADQECTEANHPEGEISVVEVPNSDPASADVVAVPDVLPQTVTPETVGCHDIGVMPARDLAVASCLGAWAVLDISDPVHPVTRGVVQNPLVELDHSAQLTWDGEYAVIGDEHAGAAGGGGCSPDQQSPVGAMWFYNITDPDNPVLEGSYSLPRVPPVDSAEEVERFRCTTHNYAILPMRDGSYVAVSPYYSGGLSAVDFTDPAAPEEIGYYLPQVEGENPDMWSGYWYRGRVYTNEHASQLGLSVFTVDGLGKKQVHDLGSVVNPQTQILP